MKTITKDDLIQLKVDFDKYTETAEQAQFPVLLLMETRMNKTFADVNENKLNIDSDEGQAELRAMFRVIGGIINIDTSEYQEDK